MHNVMLLSISDMLDERLIKYIKPITSVLIFLSHLYISYDHILISIKDDASTISSQNMIPF